MMWPSELINFLQDMISDVKIVLYSKTDSNDDDKHDN